MTALFPLSLEGVGFLESIARKDGKTFVRIRVSSSPENPNLCLPDEVFLNCGIPFSLFTHIQKLESKYKVKGEFRVHFLAKYLHFADCFTGITLEDPKHMLVLDCQLQRIEENVSGDSQLSHFNSSSMDESVVFFQ